MLEVGADEFALGGGGGAVVIDDLEGGFLDDGLDLLGVVLVVGDNLGRPPGVRIRWTRRMNFGWMRRRLLWRFFGQGSGK